METRQQWWESGERKKSRGSEAWGGGEGRAGRGKIEFTGDSAQLFTFVSEIWNKELSQCTADLDLRERVIGGISRTALNKKEEGMDVLLSECFQPCLVNNALAFSHPVRNREQ